MLNPGVDSKGQIGKMKSGDRSNRLQDIWVWNGRPHWDDIFKEVREQRQHSDIGVCFCGAPIIGAVKTRDYYMTIDSKHDFSGSSFDV